MPKLRDDTIEDQFFARFAKKTEPEQRGILAGLKAIMQAKLEPQAGLFEERKDGN